MEQHIEAEKVQGRRPRRGDRAASLVEYALLIALIAMVCVVAVTYFGAQTGGSLSRVGSSVETT